MAGIFSRLFKSERQVGFILGYLALVALALLLAQEEVVADPGPDNPRGECRCAKPK